MHGLGFASISVGHGGGDGGTVGFGARWALEGRAILRCVLGRGCKETTQIVISLHLVVGYLEEDWEENFVHARKFIVGWFHVDVTEFFGGLLSPVRISSGVVTTKISD